MPVEPATVDEVRARIQIDWAALEDLVSRLSDAELTTPGPERWSVKDHLAHIAEWERACTAVLHHQPQAQAFGVELPPDVDTLNDILYQRHRGQSVSEVKGDAARAHAELLAAIAELEDADLQRLVSEYGMTATSPDRRLIEKIAGDSYAHYAEHTTWISELLAAL